MCSHQYYQCRKPLLKKLFASSKNKNPQCQTKILNFLENRKDFGDVKAKKKIEKKSFPHSDLSKKTLGYKARFLKSKSSRNPFRNFIGIENHLPLIEIILQGPLNFDFYKVFDYPIFTKGIIFNGPSGTGKTFLTSLISSEYGIPIFRLPGIRLFQLKENVDVVFKSLFIKTLKYEKLIWLLDDMDIFMRKNGEIRNTDLEKIIFKLKSYLFRIRGSSNHYFFSFITFDDNHIELRGFFYDNGYENILVTNTPSQNDRHSLIKNLCGLQNLRDEVLINYLALNSIGLSQRDIVNCSKVARIFCILRKMKKIKMGKYFKSPSKKFIVSLSNIDWREALFFFNRSNKNQIINVTNKNPWKKFGAYVSIRKKISNQLLDPIKNDSESTWVESTSSGLMFFGPPGCGKTLIGKIISQESQAFMVTIKGPEIFSKFLGDSEKSIRDIFLKARGKKPSIIFFDEIDSIGSRDVLGHNQSSSAVNDRVVNQLLAEMDGVENNQGVYFICTTNRPSSVDKALLRSGRIEKSILLSFPTKKECKAILATGLNNEDVIPNINLETIVKLIPIPLSGADLSFIVKESVKRTKSEDIHYLTLKSQEKGVFYFKIPFLNYRCITFGLEECLKNIFITKFF